MPSTGQDRSTTSPSAKRAFSEIRLHGAHPFPSERPDPHCRRADCPAVALILIFRVSGPGGTTCAARALSERPLPRG
jgi:hypothetical protein